MMRPEIVFTAKCVAANVLPEMNTHVVVLAEDADGDGEGARLELQRALTPTKQDIRLGQDTYCLSTQSGATVYGGVKSYKIDGAVISFHIDSTAEETLVVDPEFSILMEADQPIIESVKSALASILRDVPVTYSQA